MNGDFETIGATKGGVEVSLYKRWPDGALTVEHARPTGGRGSHGRGISMPAGEVPTLMILLSRAHKKAGGITDAKSV